jgi:type IV pilus assembly protein PilX
MIQQMPKRQNGAALFIALIMLLVITLLALAGARETTLESRITGNFIEQQRLLNYAEGALREGEGRLTDVSKPVEPGCTGSYCFRNESATHAQSFETALAYAPVTNDNAHGMKWYAIPAPSGATEGQSENPEYGNMMLGIGTFRYEVNAEAQNNNDPDGEERKVNLRSTTAKVFN